MDNSDQQQPNTIGWRQNDEWSSTTTTVLHTANIVLDLCGIALFGLVVIITARQKILQSTCHQLVGLYALCSLFSKSNILLPFVQTKWPGIGPLPLHICAIYLPLPASHCIFPLMLAIGLDRAWSIMFPVRYTMRNERRHLRSVLALLGLYFLFCFYSDFGNLFSQPKCAIICNQVGGNANLILTYCFLICFTFVCYLAILFKVLCHRDEAIIPIRQTLFKSLFLVVFIQIGGWLIALSAYAWIASNRQLLTTEQTETLYPCVNCFISVLTSSEVPILFWTSRDHRIAVKKQFRWLILLLSKPKNSVGNANHYVMNMKPLENQQRLNQQRASSTNNNRIINANVMDERH